MTEPVCGPGKDKSCPCGYNSRNFLSLASVSLSRCAAAVVCCWRTAFVATRRRDEGRTRSNPHTPRESFSLYPPPSIQPYSGQVTRKHQHGQRSAPSMVANPPLPARTPHDSVASNTLPRVPMPCLSRQRDPGPRVSMTVFSTPLPTAPVVHGGAIEAGGEARKW